MYTYKENFRFIPSRPIGRPGFGPGPGGPVPGLGLGLGLLGGFALGSLLTPNTPYGYPYGYPPYQPYPIYPPYYYWR